MAYVIDSFYFYSVSHGEVDYCFNKFLKEAKVSLKLHKFIFLRIYLIGLMFFITLEN